MKNLSVTAGRVADAAVRYVAGAICVIIAAGAIVAAFLSLPVILTTPLNQLAFIGGMAISLTGLAIDLGVWGAVEILFGRK